MKKAIINIIAVLAIILLSNQFANSQVRLDTVKCITVQSGKKIIRLTRADADRVKMVFIHYPQTYNWLNANLKPGVVIKNNDCADIILAIMKGPKNVQ